MLHNVSVVWKHLLQGSEKPGFFKKPNPGGFYRVLLGFGFYWVFFGHAVPAAV